MRRAILAATIITIFLLPSAHAQDAPAPAIERPIAHVGDEWDYLVHLRGQGPPDGHVQDMAYVGKRIIAGEETFATGADHRTPMRVFRVVEIGANVPAASTAADVSGKAYDFANGTQAGIEWIRASDGLLIRAYRYHPGPNGPVSEEGVREYPQGCDMTAYPLHENFTAQSQCVQYTTKDGKTTNESFTPTTQLGAWEDVTVAAGTFHALKATVGGGETQWYSADACYRVKADDPSRSLTMELLGYKCGDRSAGQLNTISPPIDLMSLASGPVAPAKTPGIGAAAILVALAALALVARRR